MNGYAGLDVSLKLTSICVVNHVGSIVREGVVESEPEAIVAFVRSQGLNEVRIGIDTRSMSTWSWTGLKRLCPPETSTDARHANAMLKMQINKRGSNDAAEVARIMQTGMLQRGAY